MLPRVMSEDLPSGTHLDGSGFSCWIFSGGGTDQILAAASDHKWTVIDMATDWSAIHRPA